MQRIHVSDERCNSVPVNDDTAKGAFIGFRGLFLVDSLRLIHATCLFFSDINLNLRFLFSRVSPKNGIGAIIPRPSIISDTCRAQGVWLNFKSNSL